MKFEELIKLDVTNQIEYLNTKLSDGLSVKEIREALGVGEKKLQKYLKSINYKYDQKTKNYTLVTEVVKSPVNDKNYKINQLVVKENVKPLEVKSEPQDVYTLPIEFTDYNKLMNMINGYEEISKKMDKLDKLDEMIQWYELQKSVIEVTPPKLEIPPTDEEPVTRSFKIYPDINKQFKDFCYKHSNYKVQDIISQAIREFLEKYKSEV